MGTAKRERQKANRQQRLEELAKQARKEKSKRVGLRIGLLLAAVVAVVGVIAFFSGGDDEEASPDTSVTSGAPDVSLPAEPPTELEVTTLVEGTGDPAEVGDTVSVNYVGVRYEDGSEFDSNYGGEPFAVVLGTGSVIPGWEEGLVGVQAGGRYQLDIPADMAYGDDESTGRPTGPLTFVVDVISVVKGEPVESTTTVEG